MDDLHDDLARFGDEVPYVDDAPPPTCSGQEQANRLLARIALNQRRQDEIAEIAAAEKCRIDEWAADRLSGLEREREWLASGVEQFMRAHHAAGGGVTLKLPNGELKLRPSQLSIVVDDAAAFAKWAEEWTPEDAPPLVRTPEPPAPKPDARAIKEFLGEDLHIKEQARTDDGRIVFQVVTSDGEIVPGVTFTRDAEERTFAVTPRSQDA